MRELTSHRGNELNNGLKIQVLRDWHRYHVTTTETPPPVGGGMSSEDLNKAMAMSRAVTDIQFQDGPIADGINGISNEVLLSIIEHRLESFQQTEFKCRENACALTHIQEAMHWLSHRTNRRIQEGVEGTHQP